MVQDKPRKRYTKLLGIIIALVIFIILIYECGLLFNNNYYNQETLKSIVEVNYNLNGTQTPNWYFFYNDRIYTFQEGQKTTALGFYSYDLDGSNEKLIVKANFENLNIWYPYFYMVRNNEAYFSMGNIALKKINLSTGEITTIVKDKFLNILPDTFNNEKVLVSYTYDVTDVGHTYFAKLDLDTFELTEEKILNVNASVPYYYSKIDDSIYYINFSDGVYNVYKDLDIIYTYKKDEEEKLTSNSNFVFVQDNYIFVVLFGKVLKLSRDDYSVVKENSLVNNYSLVKSGSKIMRGGGFGPRSTEYTSLENPIFQNEKGIYKFNAETMTFEKIIDNVFYNSYVQKYGKYLVIKNEINSEFFSDKEQVIIYNTETQNYVTYDACNYTVEDTNIYLMTFKKKYMLKYGFFTKDDFFEVKKIPLNEI